ncbi:hypothetical protein R8Z50_30610 [Longispora sp. K20-0274]|uniref:hypothetical protein n=1 Tax=Longispora sp. K20-0274 TaxID=3088255 RepID=UPI00399B32C6
MNWLDLVGWAGSAVLVWSLLQTRILRLRALNLVGCLVLIGYNTARSVWPMVGLNIVLALINAFYLRRLLATRHDERTYAVVEVAPDDGICDHVLAAHAADIARFNPGFARRAGGLAFLVVSGDETVGVVLARDAGDGVAEVELDYVTPRFRDLTPGEFVYRRSHLFVDRGFRRVMSPRGMLAPYYHRIGFRPEGDRYVLELGG